jgi:AraC-like DNA-binding protein
MKHISGFLRWPARCLPVLLGHQAGTFPMIAPDCNRTYWHPTITLHLHDYAGDFWVGRRHFQLERGDITLSPAETPSRYHLLESGSHLCIHFLPQSGAPGFQLPLHLRLGARAVVARERFWRAIDHVRHANGDADSPAAAAASATLQELLLWLHLQARRGAAPQRHSLVEQALKKLRATMETSIAKPVSIADLAAGSGLSADYLARLFAGRFGVTVQRYLLLRRIELARHLLVSTDLLVSEIGRQAGMPDPQYFNKQFRRMVGQSPLAYRRQQARKSR